MDPSTCERIAQSLQVLATDGSDTVDRSLLLEALGRLEPCWTDEDLLKILRAAGIEEDAPISCEAFTRWLFDESRQPAVATSSSALDLAKQRFPQLGEIPEVTKITDDMTVEFLTDVEGNWEYMVHFVSLSHVLFWDGEERGAWGPGQLCMREDGYLVFGGDAVDKGPGDIRVVKTLLSLKQRYWSRVFIVLGNRDICKLRFYAELASGEDGASFEEKGGAYWIPKPAPFPDYDDYLRENNLQRGHVSTVRWVLDCNMGCQTTTFKTRRHELALLGRSATDEAVVQSYRDAVDPGGADPWMLDLLRVGQLAVIVGDALFIHGGLYDDALGAVPGEEVPRDSMHSWAAALNAWKDVAFARVHFVPEQTPRFLQPSTAADDSDESPPPMAMKVSQILPHVWVMDEAVPQSLLDHVDQAFATDSRSTTTKEEYHGRPLTSRSIEFEMDETARPFFEMIAHCWGLSFEEPFNKFMVSDICGAGQSAHVDHINLDDLDGRNWKFLDLGLQSSEPRNPRKVVPTVTVVVYFNSVGGF
ncbi:unnamed protein product [Symbiodinium sp. CCMP2456]|nr:unnamed protein product [Symbiodinium sp. CCMP2456]